jgi:Ca2+-binding EF-hand superfamily protein
MKLIKIGVVVLSLLAFSQVEAQEKKGKGKGPEAAFAKLDTNKDSKISLDEFKAREMKVKEGDENKKQPDPAKVFAKKDANSDGFLDIEEFKAKPVKKN